MVITNPPFSLFREFVAWLIEGGVEFSIIGNMNAITYKEIFPLIRDNKLWLGRGKDTGGNSMWFEVPVNYPPNKHEKVGIDGARIVPVTSKWFTNIQHGRRHESLRLMTMEENLIYGSKRVRETAYPKYDNYDAIEVPETKGIPSDYSGIMGVPISFLDKYNPEQFEIVGCSDNRAVDDAIKLPHFKKHNEPYVAGKKVYKRIFIRHRNPEKKES